MPAGPREWPPLLQAEGIVRLRRRQELELLLTRGGGCVPGLRVQLRRRRVRLTTLCVLTLHSAHVQVHLSNKTAKYRKGQQSIAGLALGGQLVWCDRDRLRLGQSLAGAPVPTCGG